jgi:hypothetical protein
MLWVCVFATLTVGVLTLAEGAQAGLHPDRPKVPQPPPPPPPAVPAPDPAPVAPPVALPPPPAEVAPTSPEPAAAQPKAAHSTKQVRAAQPKAAQSTKQVRAIVLARDARARAREELRTKEQLGMHAPRQVRPSPTRRPAAPYTISSPGSHMGTLLLFVPAVLAIGLLVLARMLGFRLA